MSYRKVFPKRHTLLPVVHAEDVPQALRNVTIAKDNGADGVFLINHSISVGSLMQIYAHVRNRFPEYWVGLNMLGVSPIHALSRIPDNEVGLWVDNAGISDAGVTNDAREFDVRCSRHSSWSGLYFGGVAFKYQDGVADPARAAEFAVSYVDVVTTSGSGTGSAPDALKIRRMKRAIGEHPLAIASGITPENVHDYLDADCFLVATGISDSHTELNAKRVAELAKKLQ